jgi:hypothetical protein
VTVLISNGTATVLERSVPDAFDRQETVSWNTTTGGAPVADGVYRVGVIANSSSGVRNVSTRRVLVDNTPPSVTLATNDTDLVAGVDSTTLVFRFDDALSGVDPGSVTVTENGTDVTDAALINASAVNYELTGLEPGENRTVAVRVADNASVATDRTVTVTVSNESTDGGGEDGDSGAGGGGQPGSAPGGEVDITDSALLNGTATTDTAVVAQVDLANYDPTRGTISLTLRADGAVVTERSLSVRASNERTVFLRHEFDRTGTYELSLNGDSLGTVTVTEAETPTPTSTATPSPTPGTGTATATPTEASDEAATPTETRRAGEGRTPVPTTVGDGSGFGAVVAILVLSAFALLARRND